MKAEAESRPAPAAPLHLLQARPILARTILWLAVTSGVVLRCVQLGSASLWFDEGYTAWAVSHPVGEIIRIIKADTAPPLYYILLNGWTHLSGFSESGLRSLSALMASLTLLLFVAIARKMLVTPWAITLAGVLFSFSFMQIAYAHEARFYSMMALLLAADLYGVILLCERCTPIRLAFVAIMWIASLYTNNMMAVYLACLGISWLILPGARLLFRRLRDLTIVSIISACSFAPWFPSLLSQARRLQGGFWPDVPDAFLLERTIGVMAGVHEQSFPSLHWRWHTLYEMNFLQVNLLLLALAMLACTSITRLRKVSALLIAAVVPMLLIFVYSHVRISIFMERAFIGSSVILPLLIVMPLEAVRSRIARGIAIVGVGLFIVLSIASIPHRRLGEHPENWRDATAFVQQSPATHRLVISVASDGEPLYRYYACHRDYSIRPDVTAAPVSFFANNPPQTMQRIKSDLDLDPLRVRLAQGGFDEVVLIASHTWFGDHDQRVLQYLSDEMELLEDKQFTAIKVFRFRPRVSTEPVE